MEKALKAFLAWHDRPFRKTHDLVELAANQVDVAFTISDGLNNPMTFQSSLTCSGRNC